MMTKILILFIVFFHALHAFADRPAKPNVILLLTDDLGWQDVKCYDIDEPSPMETPNMDALAKKGVLFWQAYSPAPTCGPTRCAIISGTHPARAQMTHVSGGKPPHPHHKLHWRMMSPWYTARMPADEVTLAEALKKHGYVTGHSGKWHMAKSHFGPPSPEDHGFDVSFKSRGVQVGMTPDRLTGFATRDPNDPFRLDENGYPFDQTHHDAMTFVREFKDKPFFLYYATWLVHGPWVMRSEELLNKYVNKLGVELTDEAKTGWKGEGQTHPFYCAMVEQLDYYVGKLFHYLETTDDPRWPGHKLIENTYIIFTSDNGGAEGGPNETVTDNYPLDKGKVSLMEGGTRVPLIITGPGIKVGVESDVMVNGLDFYPTILALVGAEKPAGKHFDGLDLAPLLLKDPTDPSLVSEADGRVRDTMVWHFPNSAALESTIRVGDYKLVRNYDHVGTGMPGLELYRLYETKGRQQVRVDIEETKNLADSMPEKVTQMNARLTEILTEMKASYPYYNFHFRNALPHKEKVPAVVSHALKGGEAEFAYRENGAKVVEANLIYTMNGGHRHEEWFRTPATLLPGMKVTARLPEGTTHYFINLIDENNFLVSYPKVQDTATRNKLKKPHSLTAIKAKETAPLLALAQVGQPVDLLATGGFLLNKHWELKDGVLSSSKTPGGIIWSKDAYENFQITLDYKTSEKCNSGLFFRSNPRNPVQGGFEIQIASDGFLAGKHVVGALYDAKAPAKAAGKPDGEWNTMTLTCQGPKIAVVLNGEQVLDVNIDDWTTPNQNPDGSKNKFKTALKDLPRSGHVGLQYHGKPISFRNIKVKSRGGPAQ